MAAAITAGANALANGYAQSQGAQVDWNNVNNMTYALAQAAFEDTQKFRYKYSRDQELQADITAYRFMENTGWGGNYYIEALQLIKGNNPLSGYALSEDSDHPSNDYRIGFLQFVVEHPEVGVNQPKKTFETINLN